MASTKSYVIGLIEIDSATPAQPEVWVTLAGDDRTLDSLLCRLAGTQAEPAAGCSPRRLEPAVAGLPDRLPAKLADLSRDLSLRLAEFRGHLLTAAGR